MGTPILEARGLTKRFPGVVALRDVSFDLRPGEIHALCGENGAGKSTLIKLLGGIHPHGSYEGELQVNDQPARFRTMRDAETAGIAVITQELALVDELSVAENIFLGRAPRRGIAVDWLTMHRRARALLQDFGLEISPDVPVRELGIGQKQLIEIVRAMDKKSRVLVLDEPTAALTSREVEILLDHLRRLRAWGTACIYISHKLDEVFAVADRITILRDGASVATLQRAEATIPLVIRHMVGREITDLFPRRIGGVTVDRLKAQVCRAAACRQASPSVGQGPAASAKASARQLFVAASEPAGRRRAASAGPTPVLSVNNLAVAGRAGAPSLLQDISFDLYPGEVLGLGGLMGAGRTELVMHIFGAWGHRVGGNVQLQGQIYSDSSPRESIRRGLMLASEDRRRYGLILGESVGFNLSLASLRKVVRPSGSLDLAREHTLNAAAVRSFQIKARDQQTPVSTLSGGNQQKVVLGKTMMTEPSVIILDEPTRGIDVGAKVEVYHLINRLVAEGKAVILVSSELQELMGMSDRVIMICNGRIGGTFVREEFSEEKLLSAALGARSRQMTND